MKWDQTPEAVYNNRFPESLADSPPPVGMPKTAIRLPKRSLLLQRDHETVPIHLSEEIGSYSKD